MIKRLAFRAPLVVLLSSLATTAYANPTVEALIVALKSEIQRARSEGAGTLVIERVDLELATTTSVAGEIGVDISVPLVGGVEAEAGEGNATTQVLRLSFSPAGAPIVVGAAEGLGLASAIRTAKQAIITAANDDPPFRLDSFSYEFEFDVEWTAEAGFRFKIVGAGVETTNQSHHRMVVVFTQPVEA